MNPARLGWQDGTGSELWQRARERTNRIRRYFIKEYKGERWGVIKERDTLGGHGVI